MIVTAPQFSFVQFGECLSCSGAELEVKNASDVCFQFLVAEGATSVDYTIVTDTNEELFRSTIEAKGAIDGQYLFFVAPTVDLYELLAENRCFKFGIGEVGKQPECYSNLFKYSPSVEYTVLLEYRCEEELSLGFYYPSGVFNRIRIPVRIYKPQPKETRNIYATRSGKQLILSASITKEFELETDWMGEDFHDKLNVALIHDITLFDGKQFTKSADYKIDWDENEENFALATCKVLENIIQRNINCGGTAKMADSVDLQKLVEIVANMWPIGVIIDYAGDVTKIPEHWELCDGKYSEKLAKNRPDLRGRVTVGCGTYVESEVTYSYDVGSVGGEAKHKLGIEEIPNHTHTFCSGKLKAGAETRYERVGEESFATQGDNNSSQSYDYKTKSAGGDTPHENRQPYWVTAKIIRVSNPTI